MLFDNPALQSLKKSFDAEKVKKEGVVRGTERGFGFLEVAGDKQSYFITPQAMRNVINGDRVIAIITEDTERNKFQAQPDSLVESALKDTFVARVSFLNNKLSVVADSPSIKQNFIADDSRPVKNVRLNEGDWVICKLKKHALVDGNFRVDILEEITYKDDPHTPWVVSLRALGLPTQAPESLPEYPFLEESLPREDLTSLPFVTIDSQKTEDMDDALYVERLPEGGFKLYVAIADPTGYIDEDSKLDDQAAHQAFSIYLPGNNIPMLPRELSDNLCSLREDALRPALVGIIHVLNDGKVDTDATEFKLAMIKSHGKLIYNYVSDYLENGDTTNFNPSEVIKQQLEILVELTKVRDNYRSTELASFRPHPDYEFILNEEGALDHIEVNHRRIANQIVEECMIAANVACGDFLAENLNTGIFNTHWGFDEEYMDDAIELLGQFGFTTTNEELKSIPGFCKARRFANSQECTYLDNMLRRFQEYSQVTINPGPHYALGVENYATWTSPIRKYGDMINHRLIKSVICDQHHPRMPNEDTLMVMNMARRTNRMAERSVREWLYAEYLAKDLEAGTIFNAEIFDVVRGGLRINLVENGAMVFVPISMFSSERDGLDFNITDGTIYFNDQIACRLGDLLKVKLVSIDNNTRSIVASPVELPLNMKLANVEEAMQRRAQQLKEKKA